MQMMIKNKNGITLITLVITIIVLLILLGITIDFGSSEIHEIKDQKIESELIIVQEAVMQRFALAKSSNQLGIIADSIRNDVTTENDTNRPSEIIGTRIANMEEKLVEYGFSDVTLLSNYELGTSGKKYEEYYYLLDENELSELGIKKGSADDGDSVVSYIVNYSTGEIFDITNKKYYQTDTSIYTKPTDVTINQKSYDFNDDDN